jgi:hypothetical protein
MALFKPYKITSDKLEDLAIQEGQIVITTDTKKLYVDVSATERIEITADVEVDLSDYVTTSTLTSTIGEEASARQKQDQLLEQAIDDKLGADDIIAGSNVQVSHDDVSGHITISATDTKYTAGTGLGMISNGFYILNGGVGLNQLANDSVSEDKLADGAVDTVKIADGAVTADKLAEGVIPEIPDVTLASLGVTATAQELNYTDGVTSNIQTQLNGKAASSHTHSNATTTAAGFLPKLGGGTTNYLRADGTWAKPPDTNTTYSDMEGATSSAAGTHGLVPAPAAGAANRYLRSDGIWQAPPNTNTTYTLSKSGSTITLSGSDGSSTSVTDSNATYSLSSFGITATAAELNKLDGVTATAAELNYVDGVTSNIQTQLNGKAASNHSHSYLPLAGGTLTGTLTSRALTPSADSTYDIGTSTVRYRNIYTDSITASTINGTVTNATTATQANYWTTARTLTFTGDATGSVSIRGNANMSCALTLAANSVTANEIASGAVGLPELGSAVGTVAVQSAAPTDSHVKLWIKV